MNRTDRRLSVLDVELGLWWYLPQGKPPFRAIVMAHGFAAVKELYLDRFAERFVLAGFAVAVFDHRGFGASGGEPYPSGQPILKS